MTDTEREDHGQLLAGLVPGDLAAAYQNLLDRGHIPSADAADLAGSEDMLVLLTSLGLAHPTTPTLDAPAGYAATRPDVAVETVLTREQETIASSYERMLRGFRRLVDVQSCTHDATARSGQLVQVYTDGEQITDLSATMINHTKQDWMTLETHHHELPLTEEATAPVPESLRGKIQVRAIYDQDFARDPIGQQIIKRSISIGERARILADVPMKMKLADTAIAMLPLTPSGTRGAVVIRAEPILRALRDYYEDLWERAVPFGGELRASAHSGLSDTERRVLELAAQGLSDSAIARRAGIHVSTVRRHLKEICQGLHASSRFAAGVAAQRKGWLKDESEASCASG